MTYNYFPTYFPVHPHLKQTIQSICYWSPQVLINRPSECYSVEHKDQKLNINLVGPKTEPHSALSITCRPTVLTKQPYKAKKRFWNRRRQLGTHRLFFRRKTPPTQFFLPLRTCLARGACPSLSKRWWSPGRPLVYMSHFAARRLLCESCAFSTFRYSPPGAWPVTSDEGRAKSL